MVEYRLTYTNGSIVFRSFGDKQEAWMYAHNEGDHLLEFENVAILKEKGLI